MSGPDQFVLMLLASAGMLLVGILGCITCCCCCCLPAICGLFTRTKDKHDCCPHSSSRSIGSMNQIQYFSVPQANVYSETTAEIPVVEAYIVPPLAGVNPTPRSVPSSGLDDSIVHPDTPGGFRDVWAVVLFGVQLVVVAALACQAVWPKSEAAINPSDAKYTLGLVGTFVVTVGLATCLLASSVLYFVVSNARNMIVYMLFWNIFSLAAMSLISLLTLQVFASLLFGVMAMFTYCYYLSVQDRIPFASAVLSTACAALQPKLLALLFTSAAGLAAQVAWLFVWSAAAYVLQQQWRLASDRSPDDDEAVAAQFSGGFILLLLSLYWTTQVIQYVVSVTASGTVACWYFQPLNPAPVKGSLFRALTMSFGSICVGALLVSAIMVLKHLVQALRRREERRRDRRRDDGSLVVVCLLSLLEALVGCIERAVQYINRYAYAYVAAYGYDFFTSGKQVMSLFERRGWAAVVNDNLINYVLSLVAVGLAVVGAVVGAIALPLLSVLQAPAAQASSADNDALMQLMGVGLVAGAVVAGIVGVAMVNMLDAAVAMIFVCFAEDPAMLQALHPAEFELLLAAWQKAHPSTVAWIPLASNANTPLAAYALNEHGGQSHDHGRLAGAGDVEMQAYTYQRPQPAPALPHCASAPPPFNPHFNQSHTK